MGVDGWMDGKVYRARGIGGGGRRVEGETRPSLSTSSNSSSSRYLCTVVGVDDSLLAPLSSPSAPRHFPHPFPTVIFLSSIR